jgi:hypothetical protein
VDSDFITSLVGALVGGAVALVGVFWADWLQRRRDRAEEQNTVRAFLQAILTELETCWDRAKKTSNPALESLPPGKAFETEVFIKTDFFTVYHNNSHYFGQVRDNDLRKQIVATITTYKALVETYNVNTQFFVQWQETKNLEFVTRDEELKRYYGRKAEYEYEKLRGWDGAAARPLSAQAADRDADPGTPQGHRNERDGLTALFSSGRAATTAVLLRSSTQWRDG